MKSMLSASMFFCVCPVTNYQYLLSLLLLGRPVAGVVGFLHACLLRSTRPLFGVWNMVTSSDSIFRVPVRLGYKKQQVKILNALKKHSTKSECREDKTTDLMVRYCQSKKSNSECRIMYHCSKVAAEC